MVDLIVPAGTVVTISQPSQVEPRYAVFRMESNSKIVASIDLNQSKPGRVRGELHYRRQRRARCEREQWC